MTILSDFIVAEPAEAEEIMAANGEHAEQWTVYELKNVMPEDIAPLHFVLSEENPFAPPSSTEVAVDYEKPFENALEEFSAFPLLANDGDGRVLLELPESLTRELAAIENAGEVAVKWFQFMSLQMTLQKHYNSTQFKVMVEKLQKIARSAVDQRKSLLLWICG